MQNNELSKNFNPLSLLKFTLPTIITFLFQSTYTIVDGIFVAQLVGEDALAAVNIVVPVFGIAMAVSLMFATGGNAIISKLMGEGKNYEARQFLTVIYIIGGALGCILMLAGFIFPDQIVRNLGANDALFDYAVDYLISLAGFSIPIFFLMNVQTFLITAGKPTFSLIICIVGGIANMLLDYVFISPNLCNLGIAGAGLATGIGNAIPAVIGFFYFIFARKGTLYFAKPSFHLKTIFQSMYNGSSELIGNLSSAITVVLFNAILLKLAGESGVAAISAIMYIQMLQNAIYFGYVVGVSPIIGYNYGAQNRKSLHKVVQMSFAFLTIASVLIIICSVLFSEQAIGIFIARDSPTFEMAVHGLLLFLPAFLFMGYNILFSALFTSLSNGCVSAILSVARTLVFMVGSLLIMPRILNLNGVWLAVPVAEFLSIMVGLYFYKKYKKHYGY